MNTYDRLALWILIGLILGGILGTFVGLVTFDRGHELRVNDGCDETCLSQIEQFSRDCVDPLKPHNGCPGPVGPRGTFPAKS